MASKGCWIALVDVVDPTGYKAYVLENAAAFQKYGARFLVRGGTSEILEGSGRSRIVVIEFKDYATAIECYRFQNTTRRWRSEKAGPLLM